MLHPKHREDLEVNESVDGMVIYHPKKDTTHFLNHTAAAVFEFCNGNHSIAEIAVFLEKIFTLDDPPLKEVEEIIASFKNEELLQSE